MRDHIPGRNGSALVCAIGFVSFWAFGILGPFVVLPLALVGFVVWDRVKWLRQPRQPLPPLPRKR